MNLLPTFATYALKFAAYKYLFIFIGTVIEGPILMLACGFLLKLKLLEFVPVFLAVVFGDLVGDLVWYGIGRYFLDGFSHKHGHRFGVSKETIARAKELFLKYNTSILFISKITLGFGLALATLMVAGATRVPLLRYLVVNFIGETILVGWLFVIGYSLGQAYTLLADNMKYYFIGGLALLIPTLLYFVHRYFKIKVLNPWSPS